MPESIVRMNYSVLSETPDEDEFGNLVEQVSIAIKNKDFTNKYLHRAVSLMQRRGGEEQFSSTIYVNCDVNATIKWWAQMERYKFATFTTSTSTMKRIMTMDFDKCFHEQTNTHSIDFLKDMRNAALVGEDDVCETEVLYSTPLGMELTAGMSFSYRCLQNIYSQRCDHKLQEWKDFCSWIETLPMAEEFLIDRKKKYGIINIRPKEGDIVIINKDIYAYVNKQLYYVEDDYKDDVLNAKNSKERSEILKNHLDK